MAHTCPECGQACHCGGDIDDIDIGEHAAEDACTCCPPDGVDDDDIESEEGEDDGPQFDRYNRSVPPLDLAEEDRRWNYVERTAQ